MRALSYQYSCKFFGRGGGLVVLLLATSPASAQQPMTLPGITIEGATLDKGPLTPRPAGTQASAGELTSPDRTVDDTVLGVAAETVGNAVTVVSGEDLRRQQIRNAADALRSLPGVAVNRQGGVGNLTQVRIRGAEANHTLVLIDGIVANNTADGEFDFSNLSAEEIERIEIIRGPMSSLYGSNAVGGVVNIVSRRGQGPLTATLQTETGSFASKDVVARLSGGSDKANLALAYQWRQTQGFNIAPVGDEQDGSRLSTFALRAGARLMDNMSLDVTLRNSEKRADRDGFGDFSAPAGSLAQAFDDRSTLSNSVFLAGANLKWDTFNGSLSHEFKANYNGTTTADTDRTFFSNTKNISQANSFAYLGTLRLDTPAIWGKHSLSALLETDDERFTPEGSFADGRTRERGRLAFAGEWRSTLANRLFLTAGIRRDDNDNFQDFTTWRTALSLPLPELGVRPHASTGTAVKLPTMFEQFGTDQFFLPNPNLRPEQSFGWDAGLEFSWLGGRVTLDVTYFHANLTDKIDGFVATAKPGVFTAVNLLGESTRQGVEIASRLRLAQHLTWGAAYTYTDARNPDGEQEVRRPPHAARTDLSYGFAGGRGSANLAVIYNGSMEDIGFVLPFFTPQPRLTLPAYWLVNATVSYKLQPGLELFGRVENLLDQHYQESFGFAAAPLAAFAGVKLTFGGPEGLGGSWGK
jgi:vitamin B12 transporter